MREQLERTTVPSRGPEAFLQRLEFERTYIAERTRRLPPRPSAVAWLGSLPMRTMTWAEEDRQREVWRRAVADLSLEAMKESAKWWDSGGRLW